MTRNELQQSIIDSENNEILCIWCTRLGKTRASLLASKGYTLIICAENLHIENWKNEINKWCPEDTTRFTLILYHNLHKVENAYHTIIFDEIHHGFSNQRVSYLTLPSVKKIFLSASVKEEMLEYLLKLYPNAFISKVTLQQAINSGILPEPKIILVETELNNVDKNHIWEFKRGNSKDYVKIECDFKNRWEFMKNKIKYQHLLLEVKCTELEYNQLLEEAIEFKRKTYYRSGNNEFLKNSWLQETSKRKRWLSSIKNDSTIKVINSLENKRFLCFVGSIETAIKLGGENAVHSKQDEEINIRIFNDFNSGKINSIFAVNKLQEGVALNNVEAGIIAQLDNNDRSFIQRSGKVKSASIHLIQGNLSLN
jgi:superfamily II DNA or RNA helicase